MSVKRKAVFFDRDGIITENVDGEAARDPDDLRIIPDIIPVIKIAKKYGFLVIVVSNQPDIALGKITLKTKEDLEKKFLELLRSKQLVFDKIYYCNHHPKSILPQYAIECDCKKPKPGMILKACKEFNIDLSGSYILGDRASDIRAGEDAGVTTILYDPDKTQGHYLLDLNVTPDYTIKTLGEAGKIICKQL